MRDKTIIQKFFLRQCESIRHQLESISFTKIMFYNKNTPSKKVAKITINQLI